MLALKSPAAKVAAHVQKNHGWFVNDFKFSDRFLEINKVGK